MREFEDDVTRCWPINHFMVNLNLVLTSHEIEGNREPSRHGRFRILNSFPVLGHREQISMAGDPSRENVVSRQQFVRVHQSAHTAGARLF